MSMFDNVSVGCPNCGKATTHQSKWGPGNLDFFTLETAPLPVVADIYDEGENNNLFCGSCGVQLEIEVNFAATVRVKSAKERKENFLEN